jgi:hypothetical protein
MPAYSKSGFSSGPALVLRQHRLSPLLLHSFTCLIQTEGATAERLQVGFYYLLPYSLPLSLKSPAGVPLYCMQFAS